MTSKEQQRARSEAWIKQQQEKEAEQLKALLDRQKKTRRRLQKINHARREDRLALVAGIVEAAGLLWADVGWLEKQLAKVAKGLPKTDMQDEIETDGEDA